MRTAATDNAARSTRLVAVTTHRPLGTRIAARGFAVPVLVLALAASACAGGSTPESTVTAADDVPETTVAATAVAPAEAATEVPEPAQEPAEAPEPAQDPQGDTSITVPEDDPQAAPEATAAPPPPTAPPEPAVEESPAATVALPAVEVVNLVSGENADLATLAKPGVTLVWFWAPH